MVAFDNTILSVLLSAFIRIGDFDQRAAVELATRMRAAAAKGDIRERLKTTKTKMKFDRQIVAIALTNGARVLSSDDDGVRKFGEGSGLKVKRTSELPIPAIQQDLFEGGKPAEIDQPGSTDAGTSTTSDAKPE